MIISAFEVEMQLLVSKLKGGEWQWIMALLKSRKAVRKRWEMQNRVIDNIAITFLSNQLGLRKSCYRLGSKTIMQQFGKHLLR